MHCLPNIIHPLFKNQTANKNMNDLPTKTLFKNYSEGIYSIKELAAICPGVLLILVNLNFITSFFNFCGRIDRITL